MVAVGEDFLFYIHLSMWNALAVLHPFLRAERVIHQRVLVVTILGFVHYAGGLVGVFSQEVDLVVKRCRRFGGCCCLHTRGGQSILIP
jgi:hypothetical protein